MELLSLPRHNALVMLTQACPHSGAPPRSNGEAGMVLEPDTDFHHGGMRCFLSGQEVHLVMRKRDSEG